MDTVLSVKLLPWFKILNWVNTWRSHRELFSLPKLLALLSAVCSTISWCFQSLQINVKFFSVPKEPIFGLDKTLRHSTLVQSPGEVWLLSFSVPERFTIQLHGHSLLVSSFPFLSTSCTGISPRLASMLSTLPLLLGSLEIFASVSTRLLQWR